MVLTGIKSDNVDKARKESKRQRKIRIAQAKERARIWADNRRLRRIPLVVAHEVSSSLLNVCSPSGSQGVTDPEHIVQNLELRRQELLKEAAEIQSAIQVIRRTYQR